MEISNLDRNRTIAGAVASVLMIFSLIFLEWFALTDTPARAEQGAWVCGVEDFSCTGWETFTILKYALLLAALAPAILGYILIRGHKLSYPPGEMTMIAGLAAFVLVAYNGVIDRPGSGVAETGVGLEIGYWIALIAAAGIAATGFLRSQVSGGKQQRKAPGTV